MLNKFDTYGEARAAAKSGEEIWACDSARAPDRKGWCVIDQPSTEEYLTILSLKVWTHWETIK